MATATAVVATGAIPVIVDIDASITLDPIALDKAVGPRTRAVIPVHMWGQICDMRRIKAVAKKHDLFLVEDCCQAIGGSYKGRMVGTFGDAGCYSFNFFKNMTCGEGGAVVSKTRAAHEKVVIHTDCCGYFWEGPSETPGFCGPSARVSEIEGAILREQLKRIPGLITSLRKNKARLIQEIGDCGLTLSPRHSPDGECATSLYYQLPTIEQTTEFAKLVGCGITGKTGRHTYNEWTPILARRGHIHPALDPFKMAANKDCRSNYSPDMCPVSLDILNRTAMISIAHAWKVADIKARAKTIRDAAQAVL
jgi:dTDP-4-amino-4,6-dideoxygalactose transaminase